jgi:hypothetical protein
MLAVNTTLQYLIYVKETPIAVEPEVVFKVIEPEVVFNNTPYYGIIAFVAGVGIIILLCIYTGKPDDAGFLKMVSKNTEETMVLCSDLISGEIKAVIDASELKILTKISELHTNQTLNGPLIETLERIKTVLDA